MRRVLSAAVAVAAVVVGLSSCAPAAPAASTPTVAVVPASHAAPIDRTADYCRAVVGITTESGIADTLGRVGDAAAGNVFVAIATINAAADDESAVARRIRAVPTSGVSGSVVHSASSLADYLAGAGIVSAGMTLDNATTLAPALTTAMGGIGSDSRALTVSCPAAILAAG